MNWSHLVTGDHTCSQVVTYVSLDIMNDVVTSGHRWSHWSLSRSRASIIMGDDTTPGQGLMEMIPPSACMKKPEAVDCAAVYGHGRVHAGRRRYHFPEPEARVVSSHYNRARPTFHPSLTTKIRFLSYGFMNWAVSWI